MRTRENRLTTFQGYGPIKRWPQPAIVNLPKAVLAEYMVRAKAVQLYVANESESVIREQTALPIGVVRKLALRCIRRRPESNEIYGLHACLLERTPEVTAHARRSDITPEQCASGKGLKGALQLLFRRKPEIEKRMRLFVTERLLENVAAKVTLADTKSTRTVFHALCRECGVKEDEWPFNVKKQGVDAISVWARKVQASCGTQGVDSRFGREAGNLAKLDLSIVNAPLDAKQPYKAFERIELDEYSAHFIDAVPIKIRSPHGTLIERLFKRFWILVAVDVRTRAILAFHISYGERYTSADVLATLRKAVIPSNKLTLDPDDRERQYIEGAAFPAELDEFKRNTFMQLAWDADSTHTSISQRDLVEQVIGCRITSEFVGHPPTRSSIEGLFSWLSGETRILPNTTGSSPQDPAREDPEKAARLLKTGPLSTEEMLDLLFRNYNATPKASLGGASPLKYAQELHLLGDAFVVPLGTFASENLFELLPSQRVTITHRRGSSGGALRVCCGYASYSSNELAFNSSLMLSDKLTATIYIDSDARFAYLVADAKPHQVFKLVAMDKTLRRTPHTFEARQYWNSGGRNKAAAAAAQNPNPIVASIRNSPVRDIEDKAEVEAHLRSESFHNAISLGSNPSLTTDTEANALLCATESLTEEFVSEDNQPASTTRGVSAVHERPAAIAITPPASEMDFLDPFA